MAFAQVTKNCLRPNVFLYYSKGKLMAGSISILKKHPFLPVIAVLSTVLLLTGEIFNCCCINERIADSLNHMFTAHSHGSTHHEAVASAESHSLFDISGQHLLQSADNCNSESSLAAKAMITSEIPSLVFPILIAPLIQNEVLPLNIFRSEPRPQNKSSPPIYLLTLRFLV